MSAPIALLLGFSLGALVLALVEYSVYRDRKLDEEREAKKERTKRQRFLEMKDDE